MNAEEIVKYNDFSRTEKMIGQSETIAAREQTIQQLACKVVALQRIIVVVHGQLVQAMDKNESLFVDSARTLLKEAIEDYNC